NISVTSGSTTTVKFGNYQNATINVRKYRDDNANGVNNADPADPYLNGWTFWLDDGDGIQQAGEPTATTAGGNAATFSVKPGSTYKICEVTQSGWINSDPGGTAPFCKTTSSLSSGGSASLEFGNYQNVSQSVLKYLDKNANGSQDAGEGGLSGWEFFVDNNANGVWDSGVDSAKVSTNG